VKTHWQWSSDKKTIKCPKCGLVYESPFLLVLLIYSVVGIGCIAAIHNYDENIAGVWVKWFLLFLIYYLPGLICPVTRIYKV